MLGINRNPEWREAQGMLNAYHAYIFTHMGDCEMEKDFQIRESHKKWAYPAGYGVVKAAKEFIASKGHGV